MSEENNNKIGQKVWNGVVIVFSFILAFSALLTALEHLAQEEYGMVIVFLSLAILLPILGIRNVKNKKKLDETEGSELDDKNEKDSL